MPGARKSSSGGTGCTNLPANLGDATPARTRWAASVLHNGKMRFFFPTLALLSIASSSLFSLAQAIPPARDPTTEGYVKAQSLPDGSLPPAGADGNFVLGPTHTPAPEMTAPDELPNGAVIEFTMDSKDSKLYPGIAREKGTFGTPDPADPAKLIVTTSHPAPYTRKVAVYVPKAYRAGHPVPFIVGADGPD